MNRQHKKEQTRRKLAPPGYDEFAGLVLVVARHPEASLLRRVLDAVKTHPSVAASLHNAHGGEAINAHMNSSARLIHRTLTAAATRTP